MKPRADRALRGSRWPSLAVYVVLLLSLGSGTRAQAAPAHPQGPATVSIWYALEWVGWDAKRLQVVNFNQGFHTVVTGPQRLCTGEDASFLVVIQRHIRLGSLHAKEIVPGGLVSAAAADTSIAQVSVPGQGVVVEIPPLTTQWPFVEITVHANSPGTTTIQFDVEDVGDPYLWGTPGNPILQNAGSRGMISKQEAPIVLPPPIPIEVASCYEAYQSALGETWPVKDVCALDQPFKLQGRINREVGPGITQVSSSYITFWPVPGGNLNPAGVLEYRGRYAFANAGTIRAVSPAGPVSTQFVEGSAGVYVARDYSQGSPLSQTQGPDIELMGSSIYCAEGACFDTPYTGYKVQLVPLPSGRPDPCKRTN